ncbi:PLP-dependent aspartate aminotransferase family protein [Gemmatimonas aurantiaca]|uniref:trans-sulfuration enzyme family protein n=1 Tax=Gemmatimonas aurantiaca TaxID=173480 RepID=UPI00301DF1F1
MIRPAQSDLQTLAVHAGREDFLALGIHAPLIDLSSTYPVPDPEAGTASYDAMAAGGTPQGSAIYARLHNPTVARAEQAIATLEGAEACVAFASGMAATTAVLLAAAMDGRHVVAVRPLYGGTDHLLESGLLPIEVTFAEPHEVADAIRPDTGLVLIETPANPTLTLLDIEAIVRAAGKVPVVVDSTFATPVLQRPLAHGATMVLHSATKFLGGHGDVVAGVVATSEAWARRLRQVRILTGGILHPLAAFLLLRGLPTLPMRVQLAQKTAQDLVARLAAHPMVSAVHFPGHAGSDPMGLIGRQMAGPGTLIAFEVHGGVTAANALMRALTLITPAVSLGSTDSLIQHPAGLTHRLLDPAVREAEGITDGLLRLSVGLESADALWSDLSAGLDAAAETIDGAIMSPLQHS